MSQIDQIVVFCEGVEQGPDVRLLGYAVAVVANKYPFARKVAIKPAGSKSDLLPTVVAYRKINKTRLAFAVRDRDFLPGPRLCEMRERAILDDTKPPPYPLRRYCLESYLIDPSFASAALGRDIRAKLEEFVVARQWSDVARAALDSVADRTRNKLRPSLGNRELVSEAEAIMAVQESFQAYAGEVRDFLEEKVDIGGLIHGFADDFDADGPLWTRVNGKKIHGALEQWLCSSSALPGGDLKKKLLDHAKLHGAPQPLVDEMEELIRRIGEQVGA